MFALALLPLALAAEPRFDLAWKGARADLVVVPPVGEHLAADAPLTASLDWGGGPSERTVLRSDTVRFRGPVRGREVRGEIHASLCTDAGDICRPYVGRVRGKVADEPSGRVELTLAPTFDTAAFRADAEGAAADAFAEATATKRPVLLDFTAVWCPPCNQLALEVLHGAGRPDVLDRFVVAQLDVDDPTSWTTKDRYGVGGYPTVVVADPDGTERGRYIGYTDRDTFVAWLGEMADDRLRADLAAGPAAATPARAAQVALTLLERDEDATAWLVRTGDDVDGHRARFAAAPSAPEARWLLTNWPGHTSAWAWAVTDVEDAALRALVADTLAASPSPDPRTRADELQLRAALTADAAEARRLSAEAAAALMASLSGDPVADRPWLTALADLRAEGGDVDGALAGLAEATAAFPGDPTFLLTAARIANEAGRPADALALADRAWDLAWGDNRLRVALQKAKALVALGRAADASAFVDATLAAAPAPPPGVRVRTTRYRDQLRAVAP